MYAIAISLQNRINDSNLKVSETANETRMIYVKTQNLPNLGTWMSRKRSAKVAKTAKDIQSETPKGSPQSRP